MINARNVACTYLMQMLCCTEVILTVSHTSFQSKLLNCGKSVNFYIIDQQRISRSLILHSTYPFTVYLHVHFCTINFSDNINLVNDDDLLSVSI